MSGRRYLKRGFGNCRPWRVETDWKDFAGILAFVALVVWVLINAFA